MNELSLEFRTELFQDYAVDSVKLEWLLRRNEPGDSASSPGSQLDQNGSQKLTK